MNILIHVNSFFVIAELIAAVNLFWTPPESS